MTVSRASGLALASLLLAAGPIACRSPAGAPPPSAFLTQVRPPAPPPDVADGTAVEIARAALVSSHEGTDRALTRMRSIEKVLSAVDQQPTGLLPVSIDLVNSTLDDRRAYRREARSLLDRSDLDPGLRARLELFRDDDPLELANDRIRDARLLEFGRAFNALAEPIGRSIMTQQLAPYRLGRSLVNYAVQIYTQDVLSLQRRQALQHWKNFLARNPDAPEVEEIEAKVKAGNARYLQLQRNRALKVARKALESDRVRLALVYADRALRYVPEDRQASELRDVAAERLLEVRQKQRRSLEAAATDPVAGQPVAARALAVALLVPGGDPAGAARRLRELDPEGPLSDEARFAEALALGETGESDAMWSLLETLAEADPERSNMARHAAALVNAASIHTYRAFDEARRRDRWNRVKWVLLGPFFQGIPDRGLPGRLEWIVDAPSVVENIAGTPMRLINVPWARSLPSARVAAALARRHLEREPDGPHSAEVSQWLEAYERKRGNWIAALELVEGRPDPDLRELADLRERAAAQYLEAALRHGSLAMRLGMYRQLSQIYPGSRAARVAGKLARTEVEETTAQHIRISRGFLLENPEVAGPGGLDLRPELLDGDPANAEIHPEGVTLLGSRAVQVSYLAVSGNEKHPPRRVTETLSEEHLARVVSQLEETSYRKMLLDPLEDVKPDASRDVFFERARLGLAERIDRRPGAISSYAYRGVRERYGMVRSRESVLPFDIVFSASLSGLDLGAFPRIRPPRETPDAMLYR